MATGLLLAVGGGAIGGGAWGGFAVGGVAIGGFAAGLYAFGGAAFGRHTLSSRGKDPQAAAFFEPWAYEWTSWMAWLGIGVMVVNLLAFAVAWGVIRHQERSEPPRD